MLSKLDTFYFINDTLNFEISDPTKEQESVRCLFLKEFYIRLKYIDKKPNAISVNRETIHPSNGYYAFDDEFFEPTYEGGEKEMEKFIKSNLKIPHGLKEGSVFFEVHISKEGKLLDAQNQLSMQNSNEFDKEALLVVKKMKKWQAGYSIDRKTKKKTYVDGTTIVEVHF